MFFSGTGNSYYVAKKLAEYIDNSQVMNIPTILTDTTKLNKFDRIGLVFPVHGFGLPIIVKKFIKEMKQVKGKYIFAIATYGCLPLNTLKIVQMHIEREGLQLNYYNSVKMPSNWVLLVEAGSDAQINKTIQKATKKIKYISDRVNSSQINKSITKFLPSLKSLNKAVPGDADKKFAIETACTSCGHCAKICPVNNIEIINGEPIFKHNCQFCLGCFHFCPNEAINIGTKTVNKKRYRYFKSNGS